MTDRAIMEQSLKALEGSVDTVQREYDSDWRLLLPSRKAQLDGMKERLDAHKSTIAALVGVVHHKSTSLIGVDCEQIAVFIRPVEKGTKLYTISPQRTEQESRQCIGDQP